MPLFSIDAIYEWWADLKGIKPKLVKVFGGRGTGDFYPSPRGAFEGPGNYGVGPINLDSVGNLLTRGPVFTDELSFSSDFPGSDYKQALTGTLTFTTDSDEVTGSGTAFLSELTTQSYIKLNAQDETKLVKVLEIIDDENLELEEVSTYTGTGAASAYGFLTEREAGLSVASSELAIASGTTNGVRTGMWIPIDYGPLMGHGHMRLSQRIANQEFCCGFVDDLHDPQYRAQVVFDGTSNTQVKFRTSRSSAAADTEETTVNLPNGFVSSSTLDYSITMTGRACHLNIEGVRVASHYRHVPGPYDVVEVACYWNNTGTPASNTTAYIDTFYVANHNRVEVANGFEGEVLPVSLREEVHTITGKRATTATTEVAIIEYTVPAGKSFWVVGYNVSSGTTTVNGNPFKIGKGSVPITEPVNPGTLDSPLLRAFFVAQKSNEKESFLTPLYLAAAGETVRVTVTPDGTTNTTWRASLDFILR